MTSAVYELNVKCPANEYIYRKRFPRTITIAELKDKLQLMVGVSKDAMKLELYDTSDRFVLVLDDDLKLLENYGILDDMIIRVNNFGQCERNDDEPMIEKYELSDEAYNKREKSLRSWLKDGANQSKVDSLNRNQCSAGFVDHLKIGDRCKVLLQNVKFGTISYIGPTDFKPGNWVGITYDEPVGKHDGSCFGKRYFQCEENHGAFVRPKDVVTSFSEVAEGFTEI